MRLYLKFIATVVALALLGLIAPALISSRSNEGVVLGFIVLFTAPILVALIWRYPREGVAK